MLEPTPVLFHQDQLAFQPLYEWSSGQRIPYPETAARAESILGALREDDGAFDVREPKAVPLAALRQLHGDPLLTLYTAASRLEEDFYPSVFPKREQGRPDPANVRHAGFFCFDSGTPLAATTLEAASWSAACACEGARLLREGRPLVYSLSRPPGHHATRDLFGGYCYFNNAAIAARYLRRFGRVALLDIDFHHGNGTQAIFYRDPKVLFVSIHGDPRDFYPFFSGYAIETGAGPGAGFNLNLPLPGGCDGAEYMRVLRQRAISRILGHAPDFLVISAGQDTYAQDPLGRFALAEEDFDHLGAELGRLGLPTLVVQEGGYHVAHLGRLVKAYLGGMRGGLATHRP